MVMIQEEKYSPKSLQTQWWNKFQESICRDVGGCRQCKYLTRGMPGRGLILYDRILTSYLATCSLLSNTLRPEKEYSAIYKKKK